MIVFGNEAARSLLPLVAKPGRYSGPLSSAPRDRFDRARLRVVILHPAHLESGLSHGDTRAAFRAVESVAGAAGDLCFLPWSDCDDRLAAGGHAPWGYESMLPLGAFDLVVVTPPTGLSFVEIPRLLARAGLDPLAARRGGDAPIVAAVGPAMVNPLPLADLVDLVLFGEADGVLPGVVAALVAARSGAARTPRAAMLEAVAGVAGTWRTDAPPGATTPVLAGEARLALDDPLLVPVVEAAADGCHLELRRGGAGERFRFHWRPESSAWVRPMDDALARVDFVLKETGVERVDLAGDDAWRHPQLAAIVESINRRFPGIRIGVDDWGVAALTPALAREVFRGRRGPVTLSPWAASDALRASLGVAGTNDELLESTATAIRGGAGPITLRFGLGWPGETADDREAIVTLVRRLRREAGATAGHRLAVELSPYVPQPGSALARSARPAGFDAAAAGAAIEAALDGEAGVSVRSVPADLAAIEEAIRNGGRDVGPRLAAAAASGARTPDPIRPWDPEAWRAAFGPVGTPVPAVEAIVAVAAVDATPLAARPAAIATDLATADAAGYGRKSRRKAPASMRPASRYRVRFAKGAPLAYTSHLDVGRLFERALRRLERTRPAWHNRPVKLSFGPPLPLGWTGEDEFVDLQFADDVPETLPLALAEVLPAGLALSDLKPIRSSVESLSHAIDRAHYRIALRPEWLASGLAEPVARLRTAREILVRKSPEDEIHRVDVRPGVLAAHVDSTSGGDAFLVLHLTLGVPQSVRPEVLLAHLLGDDAETAKLAPVHRTALRIAGNGREFSPMEVVELDFPWWRESSRRTAAGGPRA
jgi:radical SAM-linked protein